MYLYQYKKSTINYEKYNENDYIVLKFPVNYATHYEENKNVYVHLFESNKILGDIIFLHGIGNNNIPYLEWYARFFKTQGYRTSVVILPYHLKRTPKGMNGGDPFYSADPDKCVIEFHNAVKDVRRTIDLIENFKDFKENNLYLFGISFGGIIGTMTLALDKRFKKGVLMITGGNWRWINFHSPYTYKVREEYKTKGNAYGCNSEEFCIKHFRKDPVNFVSKKFQRIEDVFDKAPIPCYSYDPISFAKFVNQPILFIRGIFDKIIPKEATDDLISLLPNASVQKIPTGHKSSILFKRLVGKKILNFLQKHNY
ncbi:alpha/beta hydrolase family protein [Marinitoga aeolica]|uniref:Alpha/beta hydrolase n=1 Tax=Marinitoga aeolica TaxID=2809031 RepID=A0ABY8PP93_9BACT|nr:alpha/beta hydrolase [Marinitoga aeolica]WGS64462.1 alpha/beta hydrolase [Marinitoga aeolica]